MGRVRISYPFVLLIALLVALDSENLLTPVAAALIMHEIGHLIAIRLCGCRAGRIEMRLTGLKIEYSRWARASYGQDAYIAAGGPAMSFLCAGLGAIAGRL
jgi:stage IV sporulation protein FB